MTIGEFKKLLEDKRVPDTADFVYWDRHYDGSVEVTDKILEIGKDSVYIG